MSTRAHKQELLHLLHHSDLASIAQEVAGWRKKEVMHGLFSAICRNEEGLRWNAIELMGLLVARLAEEDMEEARIMVRRLLWSLNEESGGIGWGAPEALATILCQHEGLAKEYINIFLSYMRPDGEEAHQEGNFLEHAGLQRGLLWGAGRLAQCRRPLVQGMATDLLPYLVSPDPNVRGLAARALGFLAEQSSAASLRTLMQDEASLRVYDQGQCHTMRVSQLARQALEAMGQI
jgi:hypothetical protein